MKFDFSASQLAQDAASMQKILDAPVARKIKEPKVSKDQKGKKEEKPKTKLDKKMRGRTTPVADDQKRKVPQAKSTPPPEKKQILKKISGQSAMVQKLSGARFRFLNEMLYTTTSSDAFSTFQQEPHLFREYHDGFREQVSKWPVNPLDRVFSYIKKYAYTKRSLVVADMGCGEAMLALKLKEEVGDKVMTHSFDLVAHNDRITATNIRSVPLPDKSVDIVVFCLSLMGVDYEGFLEEANRILKVRGHLLIAEVTSRIRDTEEFCTCLTKLGFTVRKTDSSNRMFVMVHLIKHQDCSRESSGNLMVPLKACVYKKR
eukprot:Partr_v1_DN25333_c0_g1_i1_m21528 putative ribosomal RNA processing 8, methyltransferase, homolog (yeast)